MFESAAYRWVPWRAWPEFEREFNATQAQLRAALDAYTTDYDAIRATVLETFRQLAADSARRFEATGNPVPTDFEDAVVREVLATLPSPTLLCERLSLRYRVGVMQLGSEMLAEQRKAAEERRQLEAIEAERYLEHQRQRTEQRIVQERMHVRGIAGPACDDIARLVKQLVGEPGREQATAEYHVRPHVHSRTEARVQPKRD